MGKLKPDSRAQDAPNGLKLPTLSLELCVMFIYLVVIVVLSTKVAISSAQPNLYVAANGARELFYRTHIHECGSHVYFLTDRKDTLSNSYVVRSYYLTSVNKYTSNIEKSILIVRDTAFDVFEESMPFAVSHDVDVVNKRINVFITTDVDSSRYRASPDSWFPHRISFMQLDTNLNVIIPSKAILYSQKNSRYALLGGGPAISEAGRIILNYAVRDTNFSQGRILSYAAKFLIVDDTGRIIDDKFVGWEPTGAGDLFPWHGGGSLVRNSDGKYVSRVYFQDSICHGQFYTLFRFDSNLNLIDTFDSPKDMPDIPTSSGNNRNWFGSEEENHFFLPTGSFIRTSGGIYRSNSIDYLFNCAGKGGIRTGYRPELLYFAPQSDSNDFKHTSSWSFFPSDYNAFDNRIYLFSSTHSEPSVYCINGQPNLGQIVALDTNLVARWVKYIRPGVGKCLISSEATSPDGRSGILLSGWQASLSDPRDQNLWEPFIYYIDSTTTLHVNSSIIITDQFSLYPNPVLTSVRIENVLNETYSYSIFNAVGQELRRGQGAGNSTQLDVGELPNGSYYVQIKTWDLKSVGLKFLKL